MRLDSALLCGRGRCRVVSLGRSVVTRQRRRAAARPAKAWTAPHTVDGQPDLTGNWSNATYTPLERPANLARQGVLHAGRSGRVREVTRSRSSTARPPTTSTTTTRSGRTRTTTRACRRLRTSLVVDPPDGTIPPLTDEARRRAAAAAGRQPRSPRRQLREPHARRALHHVGQRRPAAHAGRLQRQPRHPPGARATSSCATR